MNDCTVCGKPTRIGATHCSAACMASANTGKGSGNKKRAPVSVASIIGRVQQLAAKTGLNDQEVPMVEVKHRWMKNRNMVEGGVVFSFNHEGVARVQNLGNNRVSAESLIRNSKGLIDWYVPVKAVEVAVEPKEEKPARPVRRDPVQVVKEPEKVLEPEPTSEVSSKEEKFERKPVKKTPAKKSSKKK